MSRNEVNSAEPAAKPPDKLILWPAGRRGELVQIIRAARSRIRLSVFRCTDFRILDELSNALERGVQVDLLLTRTAKGWRGKLRDLSLYLEGMGAHLHHYARKGVRYHAKYLVADDGPAVVASLNFTRKCFERTSDFIAVTHDPEVVSALQRLFDADQRPYDQTSALDLPERLIVSPDCSRGRIAALLHSARESIRIIDHKLCDQQMLSILEAKRREGVRVEMLGRDAVGEFVSHGKLIIIDSRVASVGSLALTPSSLDKRREAALLLDDPACVSELVCYFETMVNAPAAAFSGLTDAPDEGGEDDKEDEEEDE